MKIPRNDVAEKAVIAKLLIAGEAIDGKLARVMEILKPEDFYNVKYRKLYTQIIKLYKQGNVVDLKGLEIEKVDLYDIADAVNDTPTSADIVKIAEYVKTSATLRERMTTAGVILKMCEEEQEIEKIDNVLASLKVDVLRNPDDVVNDYVKYEAEYKDMAEKGMLGWSTGISELDTMTFGIQKGHVWSVGGYRGSGKSYFGLHLANELVLQRAGVLVFNLEMSNEEFLQRMIALNTQQGTLQVLRGDFMKDQFNREMRDAVLANIKSGKLRLYDNLHDNVGHIDKIENTIRAGCIKGGIDAVVVDFVQIIDGDNDMYKRISDAVLRLQRLAQRYGVAMIILSQLNNETVKAGANSMIDGFKGAGEISQVSNVAIKIIRELGEDGKLTDMFKLEVVKVRHNFGGDIYTKISFPGGKIGGSYIPQKKKTVKDEADDAFNF